MTYSTETAEPFLIEVRFDRVNALDHYIHAHVKLLIVYQEWVFDVTLDKVLNMVGVPWQVVELLDQGDTVSSTALGWLRYEGLVREVSHVLLEVLDLVREQERVWHEAVVDWEESLQTTDDDTEDILLCKVLSWKNLQSAKTEAIKRLVGDVYLRP